jgi:hypothetical protein
MDPACLGDKPIEGCAGTGWAHRVCAGGRWPTQWDLLPEAGCRRLW